MVLEHAVRKRGFIALEERGDGLSVRLVPAIVSPLALSATCYHLADREPSRIVITWLAGGWNRCVFNSHRDAIQQLIRFFPQRPERAGDFLRRARSLDGLGAGTPLAALLRIAHGGQADADADAVREVLRHGLRGSFVLVRAAADRNVYFREIGWGFPWLGEDWRVRARGLRVQDQPDYHFGDWVAQAYREVGRSGQARVDDIDAFTMGPQAGRRRIRYTRLILPLGTPRGERCLLGACVFDPGIDLRARPGATREPIDAA